MGRKVSFGTNTSSVEVSPARRKRQARARRREEAYWERRSGEPSSSFTCICDRSPDECRADEHDNFNGETGADPVNRTPALQVGDHTERVTHSDPITRDTSSQHNAAADNTDELGEDFPY